MSSKKTRSIQIPLSIDNFETANEFIEQWLKRNHVNNQAILETMLLFESLFNNLIGQGFDDKTLLTIKPKKTAGEIAVKLGFEGESYIPNEQNQNDMSPELKIVQAYNDKVDYTYRLGYNSIRIVVKRNYISSLMYSLIGIILAILVYIPIHFSMSVDEQLALDSKVVFPLLKQFANAMLMIGAPVTFFSLIKNLTDLYIISEKSSSGRILQAKTVVTSLISVLLALGTSFLVIYFFSAHEGYLSDVKVLGGGMTLSEFISSLVPTNIIEPFETYMPFPIIIVALLITYAFCSAGEYFNTMQKIINASFRLFSKMLNIVIAALPFFSFLAILTALLNDGFEDLLIIFQFVVVVLFSVVIMAVFYLIRLIIGGVNIKTFIKFLPAMIWENLKINSAIDAVPYNIRYCVRKYGYNRKRLSATLPILAETNQDGNCYLIMIISMVFIFMLGINISWLQILGIAILIFFLSFGAANQPGSIVIGMLIITFFLQANELISIAIYAEVFFGPIQNIINVIGDIVTVAIEEQKAH